MTRWHTDGPIRRVPSIRPLVRVAAVDMFRSDGPARIALRIARTYWRQKLRQRTKDQKPAPQWRP